MKLLIVRDQSQLSTQIAALADSRVEEICTVPVAWQAIGETVDLNRVIEQQQPDYLICAVMLPLDSNKQTIKQFRHTFEALERCARRLRIPLIFLSSAYVFEGGKLGYSEEDECQPLTDLGKLYLDLEQHIQKKLKRHIILRTSWLYSGGGDNFLTSVIDYAGDNMLISVNSAGKGCPTATQDLARILLAILLQVDLGAQAWGIYHYASSDPAIGFQFVEAIVAQASQYDERINPKQLHFEHNDKGEGAFSFEPVILNSRKIMDVFGVQQKPWRSMLAPAVKEYFDAKAEKV